MKNRSFEIALVAIVTVGIAFAAYTDYSAYKTTCLQMWAHTLPGIGNLNDTNVCRPPSGVRNSYN